MADPMKYDEWASEAMLSLPQYNLNSVTIEKVSGLWMLNAHSSAPR